jgi:hypothetical protein
MIQYVAQRMMEMDVEGRCGAAFGERSPERANSRNGYRDRLWKTRAGTVDLEDPEASIGELLPWVAGAASDGREGLGRGDPGGLSMNSSPFARQSTRRRPRADSGYLSGLSAGTWPWPRWDSRTRAHVRPRGHAPRGLLRVRRVLV